jgi:hypothetical protein
MWTVLGKLVIRSHLALQAVGAALVAWIATHQRTAVQVLTGVLAVFLVVQLLDRPDPAPTDGKLQQEITVYQEQAKKATAYADSVAQVVARRDRQVGRLERQIAGLKAQVPDAGETDSMRAEADSLFAALSDSVKGAYRVIPVQQALIVRQDSTIRFQVRVLALQDTVLVKKDTTILDLTRSRDSLASVLRIRPEPPKPVKLLWIFPAPNRKESAVIGALAGTILTAWLLK